MPVILSLSNIDILNQFDTYDFYYIKNQKLDTEYRCIYGSYFNRDIINIKERVNVLSGSKYPDNLYM